MRQVGNKLWQCRLAGTAEARRRGHLGNQVVMSVQAVEVAVRSRPGSRVDDEAVPGIAHESDHVELVSKLCGENRRRDDVTAAASGDRNCCAGHRVADSSLPGYAPPCSVWGIGYESGVPDLTNFGGPCAICCRYQQGHSERQANGCSLGVLQQIIGLPNIC